MTHKAVFFFYEWTAKEGEKGEVEALSAAAAAFDGDDAENDVRAWTKHQTALYSNLPTELRMILMQLNYIFFHSA